jgi:hypothetical protein
MLYADRTTTVGKAEIEQSVNTASISARTDDLVRDVEALINDYIGNHWGAISEDCRLPAIDGLVRDLLSLVCRHQRHRR